MNSQRLSLSSSVFAGRIKKFDTYQHDVRTSQRAPSKVTANRPLRMASSPATLIKKVDPLKKPLFNNSNVKKYPANVTVIEHSSKQATNPVVVNQRTVDIHKMALSVVASSRAQQTQNTIIAKQFKETTKRQKLAKLKINMSKGQMAFYSFGLAVFMFAGFVSVQTLLTNKQAKDQISVLGEQTFVADTEGVVESVDGSEPAEAEVTPQALSSYRVDPEAPRYLRIPDIGVNARIKNTGVNKKGAVDAPKNINDVSWFNESATPGNANGSSLLLGHVSGWTAPGVFKKIDKLQPGMRFEVEKGSGEKLTYEVTRGEKIPVNQVDMSKILGTEVAGQHDLKLMTCSGKYNKDTKQFEDRYVVYAKILR